MQYYILRHEDLDGGFIDGDVEFFPALPKYYQLGEKILSCETKVRLVLDKRIKKLKADFFLTTCGAFFISEKMKEVIDVHNTSLKFFSVDASYFNGVATEGRYFLIHSDDKVSCFDYVNSEYSGKSMVLAKLASGELTPEYKIKGIKKLCIEQPECEKLDFFFVDKIIWIDPLLSEKIVRAAKSRGLRLNIEKTC